MPSIRSDPAVTTPPTTVVLLAHGSPDSRHHEAVEALAARLDDRPGTRVRAAYLDHDEPRAATLQVQGSVRVVPLLLTPAFHARVDVPALANVLASQGAEVEVAAALGPDALLVEACVELLVEQGQDLVENHEVLLVAGGSSDGSAVGGLSRLVAALQEAGTLTKGWRVAGLAELPTLDPAPRPVVVAFTLTEGVLHDRVRDWAEEQGLDFVGGGLTSTAALHRLVRRRAWPEG